MVQWLASKLLGCTCLRLPSPQSGVTRCTSTPHLYIGGGDLNPGPHACAARTSATESSPTLTLNVFQLFWALSLSTGIIGMCLPGCCYTFLFRVNRPY